MDIEIMYNHIDKITHSVVCVPIQCNRLAILPVNQ